MNADFENNSRIIGSLSVSIYLLGLAVGPLILSPLSEIHGREVVLNTANIWMTTWQIGCALAPSLSSLIAFRFLSGIGGSACLTIGGGVISDLFPVEERGLANSIFTIGPLFGPVLGPILGGFVAQRAGWRWPFWVLLAALGVATIGVVVLNQETNPSVLLRRKTERLKKETARDDLVSALDVTAQKGAPRSNLAILLAAIVKPLQFLTTSPIVPLLALYMSFIFGLLYLLLTTVTAVFNETYGWDLELCGLAYLGLGLGFAIGLFVVARTSDATVVKLTKRANGRYNPEMRLATCVIFAAFVPISFFWYGWAVQKRTHWIVPVLGLAPFGFGMMGIFAPIQTYVIDIGGSYAASVLAGITTARCVFGAFLPLAGPPLYASLGLGWGNSLLGFIGLGLIPAPLLIFKYGERLREKYLLIK
ncbi:major facilitator superfamily transporter [Colletotrichum plurivorum]|uniref:Major facilitator superfamily transporter n=1 Tax=Colletotrichum plurivorum TaxID=2175906 RepID=A0A8H6KXX4_9PEZI|nr:major facilitator superfamily transporter [Colletotrichum plurivorum]